MPIPIPASHVDLLTRPIPAVLTTLMPDGQPQLSLMWCDFDGQCARINTTAERRKGRNMRRDPRVTLLIVDPDDTSRYIEIRGDARLTEEGPSRIWTSWPDSTPAIPGSTATSTRTPSTGSYHVQPTRSPRRLRP